MKTNKFIYQLSCILIALLAFQSIRAQTVDLVAYVDATTPLEVGQKFSYKLDANVNGEAPYLGISVRLKYDSSLLKVNSLTPVYDYHAILLTDFQTTDGLIKFDAGNLGINNQINIDVTVFDIEFEVLDNTETIIIEHDFISEEQTIVMNADLENILGESNTIVLETLSQNEIVLGENATIYPNPVNNVLNIQSTPQVLSNINTITIHSIDGKLINTIKNSALENNKVIKIDTSHLENAMYFLTITSNTNVDTTHKFLVNKI